MHAHTHRFYERALQAAPEDTRVMDALGELLLGLGEGERAMEVRGESCVFHMPNRCGL
jgi:hypothetical protein